MNAPSLLQTLAPGNWPVFVLVSARLGGMMLAAPFWSMTTMPKTLRGAIVVLLSVLLLPAAGSPRVPDDMLAMAVAMASELTLGAAIGLAGAAFIHGMALAGEVVSLQMGLSLGAALSPMPEAAVSGVGELKSFFALSLYVALGGHLRLLEGVGASLATIPPGGAVNLAGGGRAVAALAGTVFTTGVRAAAPIMVALLLANIALAILSKAVPQLNVMMVAFPVTISLGLMVCAVSLPFMAQLVAGWTGGVPAAIHGALGAFQSLPAAR
jgi:flagellar biosynthetic protein FliR